MSGSSWVESEITSELAISLGVEETKGRLNVRLDGVDPAVL